MTPTVLDPPATRGDPPHHPPAAGGRGAHQRGRHGMTAYAVTFAALLVLTTTALGLSFLELGAWTVPVTLGIAAIKSTLIALFFMHLIEESVSSWLAFLVSFLLVATLVTLAMLDVASRYFMLG
jgi:cytochrome c oxidase subunit 4